jgi:endonuclease/exonuclease/phosphatase (EEP) superfamily protein YafD
MAPLLMGRLVAYDMRDGNGVGWFVAVDGRAGGMKIISWNLLRLKGASLEDLAKLIRREQPDLLLMQEVTQDIGGLTTRIGGHFARAPLPGRIHGLAMWSPTPMRHVPTIVKLPAGSVFQRFGQVLDVGDFSVANVHLSHGQLLNRRQLRRLARSLPLQAAVLGDFNLLGPALLPGFRDVGPRHATHAIGDILPIRIDRCLVRGLTCSEAAVLPRHPSDHRPIVVRLQVGASALRSARKQNRWRLRINFV